MSVADVSRSCGVKRERIGYHEEIEGHERSMGLLVSSDVHFGSEVSLFQTSVESQFEWLIGEREGLWVKREKSMDETECK